MFDAMPENKGGGFDVLSKQLTDLGEAQKKHIDTVKGELQNSFNDLKEDTETRLTETKSLAQKTADEVTEVKQQLATVKAFGTQKSQSEKTFNEILSETFVANFEAIKNHKRGDGNKSFRLKGFEDLKDGMEVKAVGDMSSANFTGVAEYTTDRRNNLIETPYNRLWLSDIIGGGQGSGKSVLYPKENGGEGAAALWTDPTADKAQMDFDVTTEQAYYKWIAGYVIVDRESIDDIDFWLSYIQRKMLLSLKKAENNFILNGSTDTNPVDGILDLATAYDGTLTVPVERIIDAAWGQIVEDTEEFYNPTHVILTPREAVGIGLNKASGSGEYDLPAGSVGFVNGKLNIGGLQVPTTTLVGTGNFVAFDAAALMFIRRMMPELRIFEDATLAKKNKIMLRIEERATLIGFNNNAIVSGTLEATP